MLHEFHTSCRFILQPNPPEFPHLVENEAFFLEAARRSDLEAAEAEIVRDAEGTPGLLVKRCDRVPKPEGWERLQGVAQRRLLQYSRGHELLEPHVTRGMATWRASGGFSIDASVHVEGDDRAGLERLVRYCAPAVRPGTGLHAMDGRDSLRSP